MRLASEPSKTTGHCGKALILALLLPTMAGCGLFKTRTNAPYVPPAGCAERSPAMEPPAPENTTDWRIWRALYAGALWAYTDSELKRAATADCLDAHRGIK